MTNIEKSSSISTTNFETRMSPPASDNKEARQDALEIVKLVGESILLLLKCLWFIGEDIYRLFVPVPEKSVKGEIVLVTGAGHGIGKELALNYASQGATVVCWDINTTSNLETVKEISKLGYRKAYGYICNVGNREEVMQTARKVEKEVGDVSILINNAGILFSKSFLDYTADEIERTMNINVMAHYWTLQAFLPAMIKNNHGHIVALSSVAGLSGMRNLVPYCTSKFAVRGMMEAIYQDLHAKPDCRIKTTIIYPYMVDTGMCKRPKVRFPSLFPVLSPRKVAKYIMSAQRRNVFETTIPRYLLTLAYYVKLHPVKVIHALTDFLDSYLEPDL